jgi:putative hemolysin
MALVLQNIGHIGLMLGLLVCSAFFSGSETAFFNLSSRQVRQLRQSRHKVQELVAHLLTHPGHLLNSLLFGNMVVNVLYFAAASILAMRLKHKAGLTVAGISAVLSFFIVLLCGEILPKSLAYANSRVLSLAVAVPGYLWLKVFAPLQFAFRVFILEPVLRIFLGPVRAPQAISAGEFRFLIETTQRQGLITAHENKLLTEVIELGFLKVRHVMRPRVDMPACSVTDSPKTAAALMRHNHLTKLPVYSKMIDDIVGLVYLRALLLHPDTPLEKLLEPVHFVPEQKTVESLLEFFRRSRADTAVVVDEYGGIAGSVRLEDIAEELFGQIEPTGAVTPIEQTGPFEYRLAGDLAIHDWASAFGIDVAETRICTVGGLVTALLGRMPKNGDVTNLKNLKFMVESVQRHRIQSLILSLEPIGTNDK